MGLVGGRALAEPITYEIAQDVALRVYPDRRPGNLEIAGIHKALVLVRGGVEVIEEGAGFGLPIAKYRDKTYFPGSATLTLVEGTPVPVVVKTYRMDTVSVKSLGGSRISDAVYHPVHGLFSHLYLSLGPLRPAFDAMIELRNTAGVRTSFEATRPRGEAEVRYTLHPDRVEIEARMKLDEGCEELIFLNEQGATTFRRYSDASRQLVDKQMGAWDRIDSPEATLSDLGDALSFTVERPRGAGFWRGRESVRGRLSWAGLALSFTSPEKVRYTVRVRSNNRSSS